MASLLAGQSSDDGPFSTRLSLSCEGGTAEGLTAVPLPLQSLLLGHVLWLEVDHKGSEKSCLSKLLHFWAFT